MGLGLATLCAAGLGGCTDVGSPTVPSGRAREPALRIAALTDLEGTLEPCGCLSRPLGGIDRAALLLAELRADGVPTLLVTAGDLFFGAEPAHVPPGVDASTQLGWRAETLAGALSRMGLVAASLTPRDRDWLAEQAVSGGPAMALASTVCTEPCVLAESHMRVGLFAHDASKGPLPAADAERIVRELREGGADTIVMLLDGDVHEARRLAEQANGIDFLLVGGLSEGAVRAPLRVGGTIILHAGRHGHGVLVLDLFRRNGGPWIDASEWTRARRRSAFAQRVSRLEARIAGWERAPGVDEKAVDEQRRRLEALRRELAATNASATTEGNTFEARFVELGPERERERGVREALEAYARRVNEHNREALAHVAPPLPPPGEPRYVGAATCERCHRPAFEWWRRHAHGRAYETLVALDKQYHLECVGCHVTGYGAPGGAGVVRNEGLTDVGCESCHGPASRHLDDPDAEGTLRRDAAETVCTRCHDAEHSDLFEYTSYRERLLVPGHGRPAP